MHTKTNRPSADETALAHFNDSTLPILFSPLEILLLHIRSGDDMTIINIFHNYKIYTSL